MQPSRVQRKIPLRYAHYHQRLDSMNSKFIEISLSLKFINCFLSFEMIVHRIVLVCIVNMHVLNVSMGFVIGVQENVIVKQVFLAYFVIKQP